MSLGIRYQNQNKIFREVEKETPFLEYPLLADTGVVRHGFSTRLGGVSEGCFSSLNLGFPPGGPGRSGAGKFPADRGFHGGAL